MSQICKYHLLAEGYSHEKLEESILLILEKNRLCTLATVTAEHQPWANTCYYAHGANLELYILTAPHRQLVGTWKLPRQWP